MNYTRNKDKHKGIIKLLYKVKYPLSGIKYCYQNETSLLIHLIISLILITLGFVFHISGLEWMILISSLVLILAFEMLNTAVEITVDMITREYSELAKYAKDVASAATFIVCLFTALVVITIFYPKIIILFK